MKVLLEGLFMVVVLVLELVGVVMLGRSTLTTEAHPSLMAARGATTTYVVVGSDDDGGAYWVEWEDPSSCGVWGVPGEGDTVENFKVNRSESEVVGIGEAAGCRGHLRPQAATTREPGVRRTGRHRAVPTTSENAPSTKLLTLSPTPNGRLGHHRPTRHGNVAQPVL